MSETLEQAAERWTEANIMPNTYCATDADTGRILAAFLRWAVREGLVSVCGECKGHATACRNPMCHFECDSCLVTCRACDGLGVRIKEAPGE